MTYVIALKILECQDRPFWRTKSNDFTSASFWNSIVISSWEETKITIDRSTITVPVLFFQLQIFWEETMQRVTPIYSYTWLIDSYSWRWEAWDVSLLMFLFDLNVARCLSMFERLIRLRLTVERGWLIVERGDRIRVRKLDYNFRVTDFFLLQMVERTMQFSIVQKECSFSLCDVSFSLA